VNHEVPELILDLLLGLGLGWLAAVGYGLAFGVAGALVLAGAAVALAVGRRVDGGSGAAR
jgi:hypothetical protein